MKILQTVKYYSPSRGGMESVVENIIEGISAQQQTCVFFTVYANSHFPIWKKSITELNRLKSIKEATPFMFKSQPLNFIYPSLRNLISDCDIVHHHYPFPNMELALLRHLDLLRGKKLIITWHANIKNSRWSWIGKYYDPIIRKLLNISEHIIVTSPQLLESSNILKDYVNKVKVIPLSFNPEVGAKSLTSKSYPENRKFKLLFVGKLRAYKGVKYLLDAIRDLDVELTIVGEGENELDLKNQVTLLAMHDRVRFLKNINNEDLSIEYQQADLFILPSINEAEAFGVVQLEAMINAIPVINTKLDSGVPFVSLHGITGLTVEPKNGKALEEAIKQIITDKQLYEEFSFNSLERSKLFTREQMAKSYLDLYNS